MRSNIFKKSSLMKSGLAASMLFLAGGAAFAQQVVNLTAAPANVVLSDGSSVPMWGYSCGTAVTTNAAPTATCAALNPSAAGGWSPVVITVPTGQVLQINLTNNLTFTPATAGATPNTVPTSITIVGQVGGGLGNVSQRTTTASPTHGAQSTTWPVASTPGVSNTPPTQGPRVQSFATEVAAGQTTSLTWSNLRPGTYLIESGTHPSIQGPMGLYGILVVTTAPTSASGTETAPGTAYPAVAATAGHVALPPAAYDAEIPILMSEIDPVQNATVSAAVNTAGFSETTVWSGQPSGCGNPSSATYLTCYPPAVNYTPLYYLMNGVAFSKANAAASLFPVTPATLAPTSGTGQILVRLVNAGLRMHVPTIVGSQTTGWNGGNGSVGAQTTVGGFQIIAEDGNRPNGIPKVQSDVFMAAGKTFDLLINAPAACTPTASATTCTTPAIPVFDRELSLSANQINRDAGMLAYIGLGSAALPNSPALSAATANPDSYPSVIAGQTLTVSDPSKGVIANDVNVYGVKVVTAPTQGTLTLNSNGTFTYIANATFPSTGDTFKYCGNGATSGAACATVALGAATVEAAGSLTCTAPSYTATTATYLAVKTPGLLAYCKDPAGYPLTVAMSSITPSPGLTVVADVNGGFTATTTAAGTYSFTYQTQNSQGTVSATPVTATLTFPGGSNLQVKVIDGATGTPLSGGAFGKGDYRWIIEEDRTFYINPNCTQNPPPAGCAGAPTTANPSGLVPTLGVNFHTSYMPFVAQGCTGPLSCESGQTVLGVASVCDVSNGVCRPGTEKTPVDPSSVKLDPTKRYYISVLPGDAANPFGAGYSGSPNCSSSGLPVTNCGHGMGGAPIGIDPNTGVQANAVTVLTQPSPYPPGRLSVMVFEDDFPLNGEQDGGGGVDVLAPYEPGLGGFQIHLWDAMGGNGDFTGQMTYDMFNQPLTNSLDGTLDPGTGNNACPITQTGINNPGTNATTGPLGSDGTAATTAGITGMVVTCPKYESDGKTLSPLAGQAVISNLMPGRWGVIASPGADRISRGEEWLQTNTLDGQKAHDVFTRIGEPSYFQEFGPASYHVTIGFANPAIINSRHSGVCGGTDINEPGSYTCNNSIKGRVVGEHLSRTPDERIYPSGSHDAFAWSQCYVSFGDPDGEDFAFTKCNADGTFEIDNLPQGNWRVTTFDQWNDALVDGLSTPVGLGSGTNASCGAGSTTHVCNMGDIATTQWETNLYTRTFIDDNRDGVSQTSEAGIPFLNVAVRLRDGSLENLLVTDFTGTANFNETFPLFSWYVVETDITRYKNTGTHAVYDVGGPTDDSPSCGPSPGSTGGVPGYPPCGNSVIGKYLANTAEIVSLPTNLRVPGAVYCADADCSTQGMPSNTSNLSSASSAPSNCTTVTNTTAQNGLPAGSSYTSCTNVLSSGRIDPPWSAGTEGWQGFPGQNSFLEFGKEPYVAGENGGIVGHVVYASTRPFDDPQQLVQVQWEPLVPNVTINLYQESFAADGVTPTLTLVDTTTTSSWDNYAQGFRADGVTPNMSCPGQGGSGSTAGAPIPDLFFFSLNNQPDYLNLYNSQHGGPAVTPLPYNSQFKCYDGMHNWNQLQPAPYDGMYQFPSVTSTDANGKPNGTNCKICQIKGSQVATALPKTDMYNGLPQLPPGKYVVEVVVPPGMELVKEEDKNILIGDDFIAPVTQQFGALGAIFIVPDQASVASAYTASGIGYNANNAQNPTQSFGATPNDSTVPGFTVEPVWPCVGTKRIVPDYISLYPWTKQVAPFAGASRNLCDRKEVTLGDQQGAIAKFYVYTSTHIASKFTGGITDDYTSEFDPFSPQFGEKFSPPDLPVSVKDWAGNETTRVYADHWGSYNGMTYSTWEVNPPNPTGYSPTMMVFCMNDPGPILDTRVGSATNGQQITDPLYNAGYSQFCYELPFMPGTTQYLDTPVVPTSAFAGAGYNNVDCAYPTLTPAVASVVNTNAETGTGNAVSNTLAAKTGPWVSAAGGAHHLTINALGDQVVPNNAYSGPSATAAPYNEKTITRHYGFGTQCTTPTAGNATCNTASSVTIGGISAHIVSWSDTAIEVQVPSGVPDCAVQQQSIYNGSHAQCGELTITAGNGKQSIDAVTVTVGGKTPTVLTSSAPLTPTAVGAIQNAIDAASPGDMIIVPAGVYQEMLIMWKPLRLQGVGAASSIVNANTQPAGKLDPWRREVNCYYGLALNGQPNSPSNPYDPTGTYTCGYSGTAATTRGWSGSPYNPQIDRLPLEGILGWDTTVNGNLAQLLQEPTLMGAYEGAAITVLAKGVNIPANEQNAAGDVFGTGTESAFPTGTTLLTAANCLTGGGRGGRGGRTETNPYPSNFQCNPSSIDGMAFTDSSQGGGGIFVHAWGHNIQIGNNRLYGNSGTLTGGITIGQGESPDAYLVGGTPDSDPGSCQSGGVNGSQLPYCFNLNVNVHHNAVSLNSSIGDELFSSSPAGGGGVTFCTGADYYKFQYNWVCGNLSSGDGGGFVHLGFIWNGDIEHNSFLFNQSTNPTVPTNGGGLMVMGAPPDGAPIGSPAGTECGSTAADADCTPGLSDGVGPGLVINANLILGNSAESGTGAGIAFQNVNGTEVVAFPNQPRQWNNPVVTNNIIADNIAGWDGAGISLLDTLNINIINNTIISNSTTASAGVLFNALGAPLASQQGINCQTTDTTSCPQIAGLVSQPNSAVLSASLPARVTCPANHYAPGGSAVNGACRVASYPELYNNLIWQNSAYYIGVGAQSNIFQQNVVSLYQAFTSTLAANQPQSDATTANGNGAIITGGTGACTQASYWDIGVRGDLKPGDHTSGVTLAPMYSILTNPVENGLGTNNLLGVNPTVLSQYCDGSRQPPEEGASGYAVPPGISDATVPNPIFNLTPVATVDEGNNWINLRWGPLTLVNPTTLANPLTNAAPLGNYSPAADSPAIDYIAQGSPAYSAAPATDYFGNPRKTDNRVDVGAVEWQSKVTTALAVITPNPLAFGSVVGGGTSSTLTLTLSNDGGAPLTGIAIGGLAAPFSRGTGANNCAATLAADSTCTIYVTFAPTVVTTVTPYTGSLTITANVAVDGAPVTVTGTATPVTRSASVTPTSLAFGNWAAAATNVTSTPQTVTVTNTGNIALAGGTFTVSAGAFAKSGGTCAATLAVGASCTVNVTFSPHAVQAYSGTLSIAYTGATVTGSSVALTGTGVAARATLAIVPNPLTITLPTGTVEAAGTVTLTNTAAAGGSQVAITGVTVPFNSLITYTFLAGTDGCTGMALAPGASCTVSPDFYNLFATRGVNRTGSISFTDTGAASPQTGKLIGFATP